MEIWAWAVENPMAHWSQRAEPTAPAKYPSLVAGIAAEAKRVETALLFTGPEAEIDYFGRPGTTADVARLLAHEAVAAAHVVSLAAGLPVPKLTVAAARDGIDQALGQWESSAEESFLGPVAALGTTDIDDVWHLQLRSAADADEGEFRLVAPVTATATVEGPAESLLWWLHGHGDSESRIQASGSAETVQGLGSALMHPEPEPPKRRRWFGW